MPSIGWLGGATRDQIDYILSHLDVTSIQVTGNSAAGGFGTFTFNIPPSPATNDIPDAAAAAPAPAQSDSFWTFWHIGLVVMVVLFVVGLIGGIASTEEKIQAVDTKLKALLESTKAAKKKEEQIDLESGNAVSDGSTTPADDSESLDSEKDSEDEATCLLHTAESSSEGGTETNTPSRRSSFEVIIAANSSSKPSTPRKL